MGHANFRRYCERNVKRYRGKVVIREDEGGVYAEECIRLSLPTDVGVSVFAEIHKHICNLMPGHNMTDFQRYVNQRHGTQHELYRKWRERREREAEQLKQEGREELDEYIRHVERGALYFSGVPA